MEKRKPINKSAFTLIELLVVVAIIGILAAVGVVAYNGYTSVAKKNASIANLNNLTKYLQTELYKCELGEDYTFKMNGVAPWFDCSWDQGKKVSNMAGTYLRDLIKNNYLNPYSSSTSALKIGGGQCPVGQHQPGEIYADREIDAITQEQYLRVVVKYSEESDSCYTDENVYKTTKVRVP